MVVLESDPGEIDIREVGIGEIHQQQLAAELSGHRSQFLLAHCKSGGIVRRNDGDDSGAGVHSFQNLVCRKGPVHPAVGLE